MRSRKLAGLAAGALTAGMLAVPGLMAPAVAAETAAPINCTYPPYELDFDPTLSAHAADGQVHVEMSAFPGIDGVPAFVTVQNVKAAATASYGGAEISLAGEMPVEPAAPLSGGFAVPTLTGESPQDVNGGGLTITGLSFDLVAMGIDAEIACTVDGEVSVDVTPEPTPPAPLEVTSFGATIGYDPAFAPSQDGATLTIGQAQFPEIAGPPPFVRATAVDVEAVFDVNGTDVTASGSSGDDFVAGPLADGFAVPAMSLELPAGTPAGVITLKSYKISVHAGSSPTDLVFTVVEPLTVAVEAVAAEAVITDSTTSVNVNRAPAKRQATVTVKVAGEQGAPTGAVEIKLAGGKDSRTQTVTLNADGEATHRFNKLSNVGRYNVSVAYAGDEKNAASQAAANFKMPKIKTTTRVVNLKHAKKANKFKQIRVRARVNNPVPGQTKGKVRIVIKQGKKNVRVIKGVKLNKNGAVNRVVKGLGKKVNKKGQYRVVVQYTGNKQYQKSKRVQRFRLN